MGIVADDLTGACDVAACFAPRPVRSASACRPIARGSTAQGSRSSIRKQGWKLRTSPAKFHAASEPGWPRSESFSRKIDTGLRGPIGAELDGLIAGLSSSGTNWRCVVAPAAPAIGRTTRGGVQYENGVPIDRGLWPLIPTHRPSPQISARCSGKRAAATTWCVMRRIRKISSGLSTPICSSRGLSSSARWDWPRHLPVGSVPLRAGRQP